MNRADVACIQCRRRKIACSKKLPHCTECLAYGRDCCYSRDKRRRIEDDCSFQSTSTVSASTSNPSPLVHPPLDTVSRVAASRLPHHVGADTTTDTVQISASNNSNPHDQLGTLPETASPSSLFPNADHFAGSISDAVNDPFWWLASQWQSSLEPHPSPQLAPTTGPFDDSDSVPFPLDTFQATSLASSIGACTPPSVANRAPSWRLQPQIQGADQLEHAYRRCLPEPRRWPQLFAALDRLCQTAHGGSQAQQSPFLCLSKLRNQLELDTATGPRHLSASSHPTPNRPTALDLGSASTLAPGSASSLQTSVSHQQQAGIAQDSAPSACKQTDTLRRAWTLAAICLANSVSSASPIQLPVELGMQLGHPWKDATVKLFSVAWAHCCKGVSGDPVEVMQTYRMMSLAFSRCHKGHELASASVFLGCRAAATMSIHRSGTIAALGSSQRQQEALNAFWHLVSQACHFQAWDGRDMPIDMALVDLTVPDPTSSLESAAAAPGLDARTGESPMSQLLSSSPVFMTRIWTSVAIGQTIERHYRQVASLVVPCETRLKVAAPTSILPSQSEQDHVWRTARALDSCASLLQTRDAAKAGSKEGQLKRFVLMLVRYSRVLLHYPFCRVDREHRRAAQDSISAIISTVLGTLFSLTSGSEHERRAGMGLNCNSSRHTDARNNSDGNGGSTSDSDESADACGRVQTTPSSRCLRRSDSGQAEPAQARVVKMDQHLLELLAGMSVRALVFTMALIKHPVVLSGCASGSHEDDSERQRSDAVLALRALEQLHVHGVVSRSLLRKSREIANQCGSL
ncbi:uncharacterized protein UTRI_05167 [Ustilago trichophora]|uniref:Zn(2)-C6 fungal-type domain-containing protein n=1 Tax=Ustilago trichophora TaxID=86804 RepID=A0A5C3EBF7_9BASI|nr:uncharacterized protein UTRI_05167 [Ustilago trichophora]